MKGQPAPLAMEMETETEQEDQLTTEQVKCDTAEEFDQNAIEAFRLVICAAAKVPLEASEPFRDEYLHSVLTVPNRPFDYAIQKLQRVLEWRHQYGVDQLGFDQVESQLVSGSMYWYGFDTEQRPILWVRPKQKKWKQMDRKKEIDAHLFLIELGCREFMRKGVTTFTLVADATALGLEEMDVRLMRGLLDTCVANYPDRIGKLLIGPVNFVVKYLSDLLWHLLPTRLQSKLCFLQDCSSELAQHMNPALIPEFLGGPAVHELSDDPASIPFDLDFMTKQQTRLLAPSSEED